MCNDLIDGSLLELTNEILSGGAVLILRWNILRRKIKVLVQRQLTAFIILGRGQL